MVRSIAHDGIIPPIHLQLIPTNKCTRSCSFCSCSNRDKSLEMDPVLLSPKLELFSSLGTRAVTITGGGEPLAYEHIRWMISLLYYMGIHVGLVTNGDLLHSVDIWDMVTWCRISCSDEGKYKDEWTEVVRSNPQVDWSFSYVVSRTPDVGNIVSLSRAADRLGFSHMRVVHDLMDYSSVPDISSELSGLNVIYQKRDKPRRGSLGCFISLLKPVLAADGAIYPCCGSQYAEDNPSADFTPSMSMGDDIEGIWRRQAHFDGSSCAHCYYTEYNDLLGKLLMELRHEEFV